MATNPEILKELFKEGSLLPQEEMLEVRKGKHALCIGIPRETSFQEKRVALAPEAVSLLVANGHCVKIETKAGELSNFPDNEYSEAGAQICYDPKEIFQCDIILKIAPPTEEEVEMIKGKQTLISALQLSSQAGEIMRKLLAKKMTCIAWDYIQDEGGSYPIVRSMGEIAGTTSILIAGELLSSYSNGKGMMLGGIAGVQPTEVVVIGAGTVAEFATRAAIGLGASVKVFDNSLSHLRRLQNAIGQRIYTSVLQPKVLAKSIKRADVVIGALRASLGRTPCVVTEQMVKEMKTGSVIVDVSIDQGGCFETSHITNHNKPTFVKYGVTHYCVPNIASRVARTASFALSNIFSPLVLEIGDHGGCAQLIKNDYGFRSGVYMYKGTLTSEILGKIFNINYKDIDFLILGMEHD